MYLQWNEGQFCDRLCSCIESESLKGFAVSNALLPKDRGLKFASSESAMLQWMGGARRKMKTAKNDKLKRQQEYFDHRKEKQRKMELGEASGKLHTLADYIRQNLHGGESLDILGLRSLNPTPADADTAADSEEFALKPNSGDSGGVTPVTSNVGSYSAGILKGDAQVISLQRPECKTKGHDLDQEPEKEIELGAQRTPGVTASAQQGIGRLVNRNMEIPSPGKRRNPIRVGNLQTKKVASTPRLKLLDMISDETKDENLGKKRLPSETYAIFSEDGKASIEENMFDQVALHSQETFLTSDSVADWGGSKHLLNSSLLLKNSPNSCPQTLVTGTTNLLSKFLPTLKLKSFKGQSSRQPQGHNVTKDHRLGTESSLSSLRVTHNGGHDVYFSDPTFSTTNGQAKLARKTNFSKSLLDMEFFHVMQESQRFDISDPFVNTKSNQVMQEREEYGYLNPSINIEDQLTHDDPFLHDLSFGWGAFRGERNFFDQEKTPFSAKYDSITWNNDFSLAPPNFKREFRNLDHFWSIQVPSSDRSQNSSRQFGTYDKFQGMIEDFYPSLEYREISDVNIDKLLLPMDDFEVERQHAEVGYSSRDDFSRRGRLKSEKETPDGNDDRFKTRAFSENWKCDLSATWDVPWHQEDIDTDHSGGDSDRTHILNDSNSWSQTVDGGAADQYSHYLASDIDLKQGRLLPSETQAAIVPETFQDLKPLLVPPINSGDEDFIIVCFSDNEECPTVDANSFQLPMQPTGLPLLEAGREKSLSRMDQDTNVLSYGTHFQRISQESGDFRVSGKEITSVEATISARTKLISVRESSTCDRILTSLQSPLDCSLLPYSASSFGKGTEVMAWHLRERQREAYSELQSFPTTRKSFSKIPAKDKQTIEEGLEPPTYSNDKIDQCLSSNVLYNRASRHEMTHNIEENLEEMFTPVRGPQQKDINGMSTTETERLPRKQLGIEDGVANDIGFRASFSSQEESSPAGQHNTVQAVLCKLRKPAFSDHGINVNNVLLKFQRPTRHSIHGLVHQDAEANLALKQTSEIIQMGNIESEIKTTTEYRARLLTYNKTSGSRGSFPLPNASKTICLSSKECEYKRGLSEISTLGNKEPKLSLDDIDAIASTDHRFSNQPCQRTSQSNAHSITSLVRIKEVADSSVPRAGDAKQYSNPVSQRDPISEVPDWEQPSRRNPVPQVSYTVGLEPPSNAPQASERQKITKTSQEQEGFQNTQHSLLRSPTASCDFATCYSAKIPEELKNNQHNLPVSEKHCLRDSRPTITSCDADYVRMLESYVVQLKLENHALRLWAGL